MRHGIVILACLAAIAHAQPVQNLDPELHSRDGKLIEAFGLETAGGVFTALVAQDSSLGTSVSKVFSTFSDDQSQITLHLYAGTAKLAAGDRPLGTYVITGFPSAPRGTPQVEIQFTATLDGKLALTAKDKRTGKSLRIEHQ
jgi:molecular chaperone DnaK (HSP70)